MCVCDALGSGLPLVISLSLSVCLSLSLSLSLSPRVSCAPPTSPQRLHFPTPLNPKEPAVFARQTYSLQQP